MAKTTPRERRHQRTRDAILSAAVELIRKNGPDKLSLRAIARKIDYSPAGLYEYFGSKEEIIDAVCAQGNDRLIAYLSSVDNTLPFEEYLVELGLAYVRFGIENPDMFTLMFTNMSGPEEMPTADDLHDGDPFKIVLTAVLAGIENGAITTHEGYGPIDISYSLWAFVHGMAVLQVTFLRDFPITYANVDRIALTAFVRGLKL